MHQHPRPAPRAASSASNPTTNPERTNNQRDPPPPRTRSSVDLASYTERGVGNIASGEPSRTAERSSDVAHQEREQTKLNQIIQNFHTKAALTICSSRTLLPQTFNKNGDVRQNRWFNLILDDTDALLDEIQEWKRPDLSENRPLPLVIEVFVDTSSLTPGQALVVSDPAGKRWDISDAVDAIPRRSNYGASVHEVLLESWTVQLGSGGGYTSAQLNDQLPNVYKKGVVLFRSLYTFARFLPTWKLHKRLSRQAGTNALPRIRIRIKKGQQGRSISRVSKEQVFPPLCPSDLKADRIAESHAFEPLLCPAGPLSISVQYRLNCNFSIADSEALLSSRFAGLDAGQGDRNVGRSLPGERSQGGNVSYGSTGAERGPEGVRNPRVAGGGAYGSLGTFHATGKRESPVTVLRQRAVSQDEGPDEPGRPREFEATSLGWQSEEQDLLKNPPFKAGSYTSSPRVPASPSTSAPRVSPFGSSIPKRLSITTLPQQGLRAPASAEHAIASSGSSSPKPAPVHRYSSSFANRKRFASQSSRAGESNTSSGRGSESSKEKSGQLVEGTDGSSGSARTDAEDIAAFISTVERAKELKAFTTRKSPASNTVNLNKFKGMGIASGELADEMSSSSLIQTSLTPPSRRLSNVPGLSTSSSPSKALAHAPHVRSRLSTHSIAEEKEGPEKESQAQEQEQANDEDESDDDTDNEPFIFQQDNIL